MALFSQLQDYVPLMYEEPPVSPERLMRLIPNDQDFSFLHTFIEEDTKSVTAKTKVQDEMLVWPFFMIQAQPLGSNKPDHTLGRHLGQHFLLFRATHAVPFNESVHFFQWRDIS